MLIEISSDVFREKTVRFHAGLNVVLGDDNASNSIGKSTLLMIVDFVLGGNSLLEKHPDLVEELGHHSYEAQFNFGGELLRVRRRTDVSGHVFVLSDPSAETPISLERFGALLKVGFGLTIEDISFRSALGPYSRIWGKDTAIDVRNPLHASMKQSASECVENFIKLFGLYPEIKALSNELDEKSASLRALRSAFKQQLLLKVGKREREQNQNRIDQIRKEIDDIKQHLAIYATNLSMVMNRNVIELKERKDRLLEAQLSLRSSLSRVEANISGNRHIKSKNFDQVRDYFPNVNLERVVRVEEFHSGIAKILKAQLMDAQREIRARIEMVEGGLEEVDEALKAALSSVENPSAIVDRVVQLSKEFSVVQGQNAFFDKESELAASSKELIAELGERRNEVLATIQARINDRIGAIVEELFGSERKAPTLRFSGSTYEYEVFEDTGTGVAYWALLIFDIAVLCETLVPCAIHDSLLFKNIETDTVAKLLSAYRFTEKQTFIAIDEAPKYGAEAQRLLLEGAVIRLSEEKLLYKKSWRSKRRFEA